jgi:urease accessory protein
MADEEADRSMLEVHQLASAGEPDDHLALTWEQRRKSRLRATTSGGQEVGLFLPRGTVLLDGDLLQASDETIIRVEAAPEDVSTISSPDAMLLARAAYHLGNRHVRTQVGPGFIRYRYDRAIDNLVRKLGAEPTVDEVPFEPERGTKDHTHDHGLAS